MSSCVVGASGVDQSAAASLPSKTSSYYLPSPYKDDTLTNVWVHTWARIALHYTDLRHLKQLYTLLPLCDCPFSPAAHSVLFSSDAPVLPPVESTRVTVPSRHHWATSSTSSTSSIAPSAAHPAHLRVRAFQLTQATLAPASDLCYLVAAVTCLHAHTHTVPPAQTHTLSISAHDLARALLYPISNQTLIVRTQSP